MSTASKHDAIERNMGLLIVLVILSVNLMGDGLRDAFDPHSTRHL